MRSGGGADIPFITKIPMDKMIERRIFKKGEQTGSKTTGEVQPRRSDLTAGDSLWIGMRGTR